MLLAAVILVIKNILRNGSDGLIIVGCFGIYTQQDATLENILN
jgi:hypothetical protein